jgi:hypothetical protein
MTIPQNPDLEALKLGRLSRLPFLETLHIEQELDPKDVTLAYTLPSREVNMVRIIGLESKLKHLDNLRVTSSGATQLLAAGSLLPKTLKTLTLEVLPDVLNLQTLLLPLIVSVYANRNPGPTRLTLAGEPHSRYPPSINKDALAPLRRNTQYTKLEPFLTSLSSLRNLTTFKIESLPFFDVDIAPKLLEAVSTLALLHTLVVVPVPITNLAVDELVLPPFEVLEVLYLRHPHLKHLELIIDYPWRSQNHPPAHPRVTASRFSDSTRTMTLRMASRRSTRMTSSRLPVILKDASLGLHYSIANQTPGKENSGISLTNSSHSLGNLESKLYATLTSGKRTSTKNLVQGSSVKCCRFRHGHNQLYQVSCHLSELISGHFEKPPMK